MATDFELTPGDTGDFDLTIARDGTAVNLTDALIEFEARTAHGATPVLTKTTDDGSIVVTNATGGLATIVIDPENTAALETVAWFYRVKLTEGDGTVTTIVRGTLLFKEA